MTRSSTVEIKLLTMVGLLSADCGMCITGAEVDVSSSLYFWMYFFLLVLCPLSSQIQQGDTFEFAQHFGNNIK